MRSFQYSVSHSHCSTAAMVWHNKPQIPHSLSGESSQSPKWKTTRKPPDFPPLRSHVPNQSSLTISDIQMSSSCVWSHTPWMFDFDFLLRVRVSCQECMTLHLPLHTTSSDPGPNLLLAVGAAAEPSAGTGQAFDLPWKLLTNDLLNSHRSSALILRAVHVRLHNKGSFLVVQGRLWDQTRALLSSSGRRDGSGFVIQRGVGCEGRLRMKERVVMVTGTISWASDVVGVCLHAPSSFFWSEILNRFLNLHSRMPVLTSLPSMTCVVALMSWSQFR